MAGGLVEQQPEDRLVAAVMGVAQGRQKKPGRPPHASACVRPTQPQASAVTHVERPEKHPLGVVSSGSFVPFTIVRG